MAAMEPLLPPCEYHGDRPASRLCAECEAGLCADCALPLGDSRTVCSRCRWRELSAFPYQPLTLLRQESDEGEKFPDPLPELAPDEARCVQHPNRRAESPCDRCGDLLCGLCRIGADQRSYCGRCFLIAAREGRWRPRGTREAQLTLVLGALTAAVSLLGKPHPITYAWVPVLCGLFALWRQRGVPRADRASVWAGMALAIATLLLPLMAAAVASFVRRLLA